MLNIYTYAIKSLQNYSHSLTKKALFVDKPWTLIDEDQEIQKLIFKKNQELIISKNGKVKMGKWDYLPEAKSLVIDRGNNVILCNEGFVDAAALILKLDGTNNQFFVLANENVLPDLDVEAYLTKLVNQKLHIVTQKIENGRKLEIQLRENHLPIAVGDRVSENMEDVEDGSYRLEESNKEYRVADSVIKSIIYKTSFQTKAGVEIVIEQTQQYHFITGNAVKIYGEPAPDGKYKLKGTSNIHVKDGIIVKIPWF